MTASPNGNDHARRTLAVLSLYAGCLLNTLSQALTAALIDIDRSMRDRMQGKRATEG